MATFLFDKIIFGPVHSRRLGNSLGINLLPANAKVCNFDCLYCECGLNATTGGRGKTGLPSAEKVKEELEQVLHTYKRNGKIIDTITFAGNGEPTLHPEFASIIEDTVVLRDTYFPASRIAVLSNATLIEREKVFNALLRVDDNILKLDSANEITIRKINCPQGNFSLPKLVEQLKKFGDKLTIQTLFVKGTFAEYAFDNTTEEEVSAWLNLLEEIKPGRVMVYTIARDTPVESLEKVDAETLYRIAQHVEKRGIPASVST